ncbi:MAG: hypothetical protein IKN74_06865 [Clostridia bacterium]|nr:hypothetical protein [Clostridia bacterium]
MEVSNSSNDSGSSLARNLNPDRYKERYGNKRFINSKNKVTKKTIVDLMEDPLFEDEPKREKSAKKKPEITNTPLQESVEDVIKYVAQMEAEEEKEPQRFTRQVEVFESVEGEAPKEDLSEVFRAAKRNVDKMKEEEARQAAQKEKADEDLFREVEKNLNKRIDEDYRRIAKEEREEEKRVTRARKEELKRRAKLKEEARKAEKEEREADKKQAALVKSISRNVNRNIKKEDRQLKKEAREKRKEQRKIKRARGKYIPHKKRSLLERFAHMIYYKHGGYDKYIFSNYEDLSPRQQKKWQTKIDAIEDVEHDIAMRAGWTSFKVLLAACGVVLTCYSVKLVEQQFAETEARLQIERIQKQKEYSELEARSHFFNLEDQEYLKSKLDIPEGATEEEILELMKEAYANLKPEVQQWIRDPERVAEAEAKRKAEQETIATNPNEGTLVADDGKEIGD